MASVLLIDSQWTIYFNNPPQLVSSELLADLPCSDRFFEASTAAEFAKIVSNSEDRALVSPPCIRDFLSLLLQEPLSNSDFAVLPRVEAKHLTMLIFGSFLDFVSA